jgi:hypothetical protein
MSPKRGRPSKFGRPSRLVAVTLPEEVIRGLHKVHPDLAWAIVSLFEKGAPITNGHSQADAELVNIGERESLIVINRSVFTQLPGVDIIPLTADRAFLALDPGCGIGDLENSVLNRLSDPVVDRDERRALQRLRRQIHGWRRNIALNVYTRAIIVIERLRTGKPREVARVRSTVRGTPRPGRSKG